jgi:hypothetical protein
VQQNAGGVDDGLQEGSGQIVGQGARYHRIAACASRAVDEHGVGKRAVDGECACGGVN